MGFWEELSGKISRGTKTLSQKSSELFDIAKVKLDIASEKDKIGKLMRKLASLFTGTIKGAI